MIKGLTDRLILRRDGKIRAGTGPKSGGLKNPPYFMLHDAKQLIPVLGENPTEIYFTVYTDSIEQVARNDLRWYSQRELVCNGDGETAAFYSSTTDAEHVKQKPHEVIKRARERLCQYRSCPEYIAGHCSEHLFLDMVIPQYSMASMFTIDNTSYNGLMNVLSALNKASIKHDGKISGQIFRVYKKEMELPYQDSRTGKKGTSDRPVIHMEYVPFEQYEAKFRDKIQNDDWEALLALKNRTGLVTYSKAIPAPADQPMIEGPSGSIAALPSPEGAQEMTDEELIRERMNHPSVVPLFEELANAMGVENTEEKRYNAAKASASVQVLVDRLKSYISAAKRKKAAQAKEADAQPVPPPQAQADTQAPSSQALF